MKHRHSLREVFKTPCEKIFIAIRSLRGAGLKKEFITFNGQQGAFKNSYSDICQKMEGGLFLPWNVRGYRYVTIFWFLA